MAVAVRLDNISYFFKKKPLLNHITFSIEKGTITGILGQNGAGKTTLLSLLNGLKQPTNGTLDILGETSQDSRRQRTGVVLQETALYEELTTYENLEFSASLYNVHNPQKRIADVLKLLSLTDRAQQVVSTLSGGLKRRVTIARALLHEPDLLIIDEPTLGVDSETRHTIWDYLKKLKTKGRTIVVSSNYLEEIQTLCDTVAVLDKGTLLSVTTPYEFVKSKHFASFEKAL